MATTASYYLNGPSLATATSAFINPDMTIFAPDGYYSDGTIVRQLVAGSFLPGFDCPSCGVPCNTTISTIGDPGVFRLTVNTGALPGSIGAIVLKFTTSVPNGVKAELNGITYNKFSSPAYGFLSGIPDAPTYIGDTTLDCGLVSGSPHTLDVFNYFSGSFFNTMTTDDVTVLSGQLAMTPAAPGACVMVIPKTSPVPSSLNIEINSACVGTDFTIEVGCPALLDSLNLSTVAANSTDVCLKVPTSVGYVAYVNGSAGVLGMYDWVFSDAFGEFPLADGYYRAPASLPSGNQWFHITNGVIDGMGVCDTGTNYLLNRCGDGFPAIADNSTTLAVGNIVTITEDSCTYVVIGSTDSEATVVVAAVFTDITCADTCQQYTASNISVDPVTVNYTDCSGTPMVHAIVPGDFFTFCARAGSVTAPGAVVSMDFCYCP